jgi:hypothetical protein
MRALCRLEVGDTVPTGREKPALQSCTARLDLDDFPEETGGAGWLFHQGS